MDEREFESLTRAPAHRRKPSPALSRKATCWPAISAFPEVGLGIEHTRWDGRWCGRGRDRFVCNDGNSSDTDLELLLWLGVRFHLARQFALTLRVGTPSLSLGASFFL